MKLTTFPWIKISLFNLFVVALLGTLMRYKIGFNFPYFDQKHLQHAHSHFAFIGWITQTLFVLILDALQTKAPLTYLSTFNKLLKVNLFCSYGMLVSFAIQGYGFFSIGCSTLAVFNSYGMAYLLFKELKQHSHQAYEQWFRAAMWFNVVSSLGTFTLAFMMASHNFDNNIHLASLYFYLHFQYNGFFTFACFGLLISKLPSLFSTFKYDPRTFKLFFFSCIPAYFLSVLWAHLPVWLYSLVVVAAIVQIIAWILFLRSIFQQAASASAFYKKGKLVLWLLLLALSVKLLLQLGSTIPSISQLAFGFRPIIIAYLHLILLAIISVFLLTYFYLFNLMRSSKSITLALILTISAIYLNELALGVQGITSLTYTLIPHINELLFGIAVLILVGLGLLFALQLKQKNSTL